MEELLLGEVDAVLPQDLRGKGAAPDTGAVQDQDQGGWLGQEEAGPLPTSPPTPSLDSPPPESRPPPVPPNPSNKAALSSNTGVVRLVNVEDEEDGQSGGDWRGDWPRSLN